MVPLALGSQTAGSTIRPGSFCGIVAFKPQFGAISRHGCMMLAASLDHVGLYARAVGDIALLAEALYGEDVRDPVTGLVSAQTWPVSSSDEVKAEPRLGFAPTPFWERIDGPVQRAFQSFVDGLEAVEQVELPADFADAPDCLSTICDAEIAQGFAGLYRDHADRFSPQFRHEYEQGLQISALAYLEARKAQVELGQALDNVLTDYDALLTPAALGEATPGLDSTGDPIFCSTWTLTGHPAINLPLLKGEHGLPVGVQLVGKRDGDAALLRVASQLF